MKPGFFAAVLLLPVLLTGCADPESARVKDGKFVGERPIRIVTTTGMVTDIVKAVAGDKAKVTGLFGPNEDPHLHDPTRSDVATLGKADLVFYSGLLLEGRMEETFANIEKTGVRVHAVTEEIDEKQLRSPPEFEGHPDPHVWMDVAMWSEAVRLVAKTLAEFDSENADYYQANAEAYLAKLDELDAYVRKVIQSIPEDQRVLVSAHDAFGYFSDAYGIPVRAPQGITTESEPGLDDINSLVDFIVESKLKAIFIEASVSRQTIEAIQEGVQSKGGSVEIGGELYSDSMGQPGTYEGTYIGMIDHNATRIAQALGGTAPEKGWQGELSD